MDQEFLDTLSVIQVLAVDCSDINELLDEIKEYLENSVRLIGYWESYEIKFNTQNELYIILNHGNLQYNIQFPNIIGNCNKKGFWKKGF